MEHPCHRCNSPVEDGVPFCPKCGAPQIRVSSETLEANASGETPPSAGQEQPSYPLSEGWNAVDPRRVNWKIARPVAIMAGLVAGVLVLVPLLSFLFFVWIFGAGWFATASYRKRIAMPLTAGIGAKIGLLSGFFAFLVPALFYVAAWVLQPGAMRDQLKQAMERSAQSTDPATREVAAKMTSPEALPVLLVVGLMVMLGFILVISAGGGAAAAAMTRKDTRP